jgi:hypothetical protein
MCVYMCVCVCVCVYIYVKIYYYEQLAHMMTEAEKSMIWNQKAGDTEKPVV